MSSNRSPQLPVRSMIAFATMSEGMRAARLPALSIRHGNSRTREGILYRTVISHPIGWNDRLITARATTAG